MSGETVIVDVELYGTLTRIAKGHSLRLVVASSASHPSPGAQMATDLAGGVYGIQRRPAAASHVNVMAADPAAVTGACAIC